MKNLEVKTVAGEKTASLKTGEHEVVLNSKDLRMLLDQSAEQDATLVILGMRLQRQHDRITARTRYILSATLSNKGNQYWKFWSDSIKVSNDSGKTWREQYATHQERSGEWIIP